MFRRFLTPAWLAAGSFLTGCGVDSVGNERVRASLVGGAASGPEDDAVVFVKNPDGICSGTLVAPNLLLTAAHCTSTTGLALTFSCTEHGELTNGGSGAGEIGEKYPPEQMEVYTGSVFQSEPVALGQQIIQTGTTAICRNDLAFVVLDRSLEGASIVPLRLDHAVRLGEPVTAIGYGVSEDRTFGVRRRREGIRVLDIGKPPGTFQVDWGLCLGDSGGPALSPETGALFGVLSLLHDSCGSDIASSAYTELWRFRELAFSAFRAAGADWWLEGEATPSPIERSEAAAAQSVGSCSMRCSAVVPTAFAQLSILLALGGLVVFRRARRTLISERQI